MFSKSILNGVKSKHRQLVINKINLHKNTQNHSTIVKHLMEEELCKLKQKTKGYKYKYKSFEEQYTE